MELIIFTIFLAVLLLIMFQTGKSAGYTKGFMDCDKADEEAFRIASKIIKKQEVLIKKLKGNRNDY